MTTNKPSKESVRIYTQQRNAAQRSADRPAHGRELLNFVWEGKTVRDRLEEKFSVTPSCWIWNGEKGRKGYGRMRVSGKYQMAHRLSYELYVGPIPDGMIICHTCDNPPCVNPDHLWPGTDKSNADDKMLKGRWSCGTRKPGQELSYAKLKDEDVYAIRADGSLIKVIAALYGVTSAHIWDIKTRGTWTHLLPRGDDKDSPDGRARPPRLTIDQQRAVRTDARPRKVIAAEFGVSRSIVCEIKLGRGIYSHLNASPK